MAGHDGTQGNTQLAAYRLLLENAHAMLAAAREERWDDLIALDRDRESCLDNVKELDLISTKPLDAAEQSLLIQQILESDEQTRALVVAWQHELSELMGSMDNKRRLDYAYDTDTE